MEKSNTLTGQNGEEIQETSWQDRFILAIRILSVICAMIITRAFAFFYDRFSVLRYKYEIARKINTDSFGWGAGLLENALTAAAMACCFAAIVSYATSEKPGAFFYQAIRSAWALALLCAATSFCHGQYMAQMPGAVEWRCK
jgi:hypothetical protein